MASFRELLARTKAQIREVDTATAEETIAGQPAPVVLDDGAFQDAARGIARAIAEAPGVEGALRVVDRVAGR